MRFPVVIPAAGFGTRFLPATKAIPKELLPVLNRPILDYALAEAAAAGATDIVLVTHHTKRALEDYLDAASPVADFLEARGKADAAKRLRNVVPKRIRVCAVRQDKPLGLGHAVLCAAPWVGEHPFGVILPDELFLNPQQGLPVLRQLSVLHRRSVVGAMRVPLADCSRYGILRPGRALGIGHYEAAGMVEKPEPARSPSNLACVGRYVLTADIFERLARTGPGAGGEIQLTDAIAQQCADNGVIAAELTAERYDCGSQAGWLRANLAAALAQPGLAQELQSLFGADARATGML